MKRRDFIAVLGGAAAAWPLAARAQQVGQTKRVGVLVAGAATESLFQSYIMEFSEALRRAGWSEG